MRTAACHCGDLRVRCEGEPVLIAMCHCELCQRRTGTSYNLGAWFERASVAAEGPEQIYVRSGDEGSEFTYHFCPRCGTSVYWEAPGTGMPDHLGVAVGCFADAGFPAPTLSLYGKRRHRWLTQPTGMPRFTGSVQSDRE